MLGEGRTINVTGNACYIEYVENYKKNVRERESRLTMLNEMKERYKKIYGMQAAVVLNLMHKGKDLLAFMK